MIEPKLRFKADDGSQFPDWEEKKFANLYHKNVEKNVNLEFDSSKTISIASMQFNEKGNGASEDSLSSYKVLRLGDIAFEGHENKEYSHGRFVLNDIGDGIMSPRFSCMRPVCTHVDGFWKYYIHSERVMRNILVRSTKKGTMMHELVIPDFLKQSIMVPSLPEQQKIAEFLSTIDTVIEKQKETVSAWEERKKGVMQKLFGQEVRFKADDGSDFPEWEEKKLGEVCAPLTYGMNAAAVKYDGENKYIRITDIDDESHLYKNDELVSPDGELDDKYLVSENDILLARTGASVGKSYLYDKKDGKLYYAGFLIKAHVKSENSKFIYYQTLTDRYARWVQVTSMRSGQPGINANEYSEFMVYVPCLEEQQKIADCLSSLDEVIEKQKATLAAWEELKKGLLQQMFV